MPKLGNGFNSITGKEVTTNTALDLTDEASKGKKESHNVTCFYLSLHKVSNDSQKNITFNVGTTVPIPAALPPVSLNTKFGLDNKSTHEVLMYELHFYQVRNKLSLDVPNIPLRADAAKWLNDSTKRGNISNFFTTYGDSYISEIYFGGEVTAYISFKSKSDQRNMELEQAFKFGQLANFDLTAKSNYDKLKIDCEIQIIASGFKFKPTEVMTINALMQQVTSIFNQPVEDVPLYFTRQHYKLNSGFNLNDKKVVSDKPTTTVAATALNFLSQIATAAANNAIEKISTDPNTGSSDKNIKSNAEVEASERIKSSEIIEKRIHRITKILKAIESAKSFIHHCNHYLISLSQNKKLDAYLQIKSKNLNISKENFAACLQQLTNIEEVISNNIFQVGEYILDLKKIFDYLLKVRQNFDKFSLSPNTKTKEQHEYHITDIGLPQGTKFNLNDGDESQLYFLARGNKLQNTNLTCVNTLFRAVLKQNAKNTFPELIAVIPNTNGEFISEDSLDECPAEEPNSPKIANRQPCVPKFLTKP